MTASETVVLEARGQLTGNLEQDSTSATIGANLMIVFVALTIYLAIPLILFSVAFFMAVTHWCDRSEPVISISISSTQKRCRSFKILFRNIFSYSQRNL